MNRDYRPCRTPPRAPALQICSLEAHKSRFQLCFSPGGQYEALEKGRLDLVHADHDTTLSKKVIFGVDFVCVVSQKSKFEKAISLNQYLAADHVSVGIIGGVQTHPDKHLAAIGEKRP